MNAGLFFSADYRDGRVRIGSKTYPAGHYCVHLLNQYYKDDTAARISVFTNRNWQLQEQLKAGYLNAGDFTKAGKEICNVFHVLPWLKPFDTLDIKAERNRVENLFTNRNAEMLISYFRRRYPESFYPVGTLCGVCLRSGATGRSTPAAHGIGSLWGTSATGHYRICSLQKECQE